jgi:hypothetical protein
LDELEENKFLKVVAYKDIFDKIDSIHKKGQGGIGNTYKALANEYANISVKFVRVFFELCTVCLKKNVKARSKKVVVKPIISTEFMHRGQVDLIDFQSMPDGEYKWVLHYQDHHNKLTFLSA